MEQGFVGCIQYLKFNKKLFNLSFPSNDFVNGEDIGSFFIRFGYLYSKNNFLLISLKYLIN
jgi:hypothetical protein